MSSQESYNFIHRTISYQTAEQPVKIKATMYEHFQNKQFRHTQNCLSLGSKIRQFRQKVTNKQPEPTLRAISKDFLVRVKKSQKIVYPKSRYDETSFQKQEKLDIVNNKQGKRNRNSLIEAKRNRTSGYTSEFAKKEAKKMAKYDDIKDIRLDLSRRIKEINRTSLKEEQIRQKNPQKHMKRIILATKPTVEALRIETEPQDTSIKDNIYEVRTLIRKYLKRKKGYLNSSMNIGISS